MSNRDLVYSASRPECVGAVIIDFQAARAACLVDRCKGPPREAGALIHALMHAGAKAFPVWVFPIDDEIGIEWGGRPRTDELLLAENVSRRLGYRTGTHAVGNGGFIFLTVAA